jgi:hypothetical protein
LACGCSAATIVSTRASADDSRAARGERDQGWPNCRRGPVGRSSLSKGIASSSDFGRSWKRLPVSRALDREPSRSSFKIFERFYNTAGAISILGHGERVQEITNAALLLEGLPSQPTRCPERLPAGEPPWLAGSTPRPKVSLPSCMDSPPLRRVPWRWQTYGDISLLLIFANVAERPTAVSANAAPRGVAEPRRPHRGAGRLKRRLCIRRSTRLCRFGQAPDQSAMLHERIAAFLVAIAALTACEPKGRICC